MKRFFADLSARMRRLFICVLLCTSALIVAGCGGGGGGSNAGGAPVSHDPVPTPPPRSDPLEFGYYGTWENSQVADTADHVTFMWVMSGDVGLAQLQEAQARGVKRGVVDVSWLVYTTTGRTMHNGNDERKPHPQAAENLREYLASVRNLGMLPVISALYPQDEPDVHGIHEADVVAMNKVVREVAAEFGLVVPLVVIYGTDGTPGIASYDVVGMDDYGSGANVISRIDAMVAPTQKKLLVPGGSCPWFNDIQPFFEKAQADVSVWGIAAFIWTDRWGGTSNCGIRSAPTRNAYVAVGKHIKGNATP
jgi:hypothetical protein